MIPIDGGLYYDTYWAKLRDLEKLGYKINYTTINPENGGFEIEISK